MSTTLTATATEPTNELSAPSIGLDADAWGNILNESTLPTLLGYILWLKENGSSGGGIAPSEGLVVVKHGATAATERPTAATVYWMGSVPPDNKTTGDLWLETGAFD